MSAVPELPGIVTHRGDFMDYEPGRDFDLVLCLQVLEHLPDPAAFCRKLLRLGRVVIVSVPYRWPPDKTGDHLHDPVDRKKLRAWAGRGWIGREIVEDFKGPRGRRLIAVFIGDPCPLPRRLMLRWKTR